MDDIELARLEHENLVEAFALIVGHVPGALVRRDRGVAVLASGLPVSLFNQVLIEVPAASPDAIRDGIALMRERGAPWLVYLREGHDDSIVPLLVELGLAAHDDAMQPGMALHPLPADAPPPTHDIRVVRDEAGVADHVAVIAASFEMPVELVERLMVPELATVPGVAVYVGYLDGEPITSGAGIRTGRTTGVYNIGTVPDARRRGFGREITERIAADGRASGCDVAILQASDMGRSVYERLGYRTVTRRRVWTEPG